MTLIRMQIGLFIDFPPLLGPAALVLGMSLLVVWNYREHYLSALPFRFGQSWIPRTVVILPLAGGVSVAAGATMLRYESLWVYSVVLFLSARLVQGALLVYGIRKTAYYLSRIITWVTSSEKSGSSSSVTSEVISKLLGKFYRAAVKKVAVFLGVIGVVGGILFLYRAEGLVIFSWAVLVMLTTTTTLLIRLRDVAARVGRLPVIGVLFCVGGAEVYNLPQVPPETFGRTVENLLSIVPVQEMFPSFSFLDLGLIIASQVALLVGVVVALLFLFVERS